jgi:acetylornithine deacetylase
MQLSRAARLLRDYVAIPSVNPMGRSDIDPAILGERRYAEQVKADLQRLGVDAVIVGKEERASVVAQLRSPEAVDTLLIASHLDTVPIEGMTIAPFDPLVREDRLYGRGACDTKAGMAALIAAVESVLARGRLRRNVIIVGEADEEMSSVGVYDVIAHLAGTQVDWALATEPTGLRLTTCHKGRMTFRLEAHGQACHSSNPDLGKNAIAPLARAVLALGELHTRLGTRTHPRLGSGTLAVTLIGGGHASNIVPDRAFLIADRRTLPDETPEDMRAELEHALAGTGVGERVTIAHAHWEKNALGTPDDHPAVQHCQRALTGCGLPAEITAVAFATDAGPLAAHGIPGVVLGPGSIAQAHTADEFVPLAEVDAMQAVFERLLSGDDLPVRQP